MNRHDTLTTGNLWFALPRISAPPLGLDRLAFLMMAHRGLIELSSGDETPFMSAGVEVDRQSVFAGASVELLDDWIPIFRARREALRAKLIWLAPRDERGWLCRVELCNEGHEPIEAAISFRYCWGKTVVTTYEADRLSGHLCLDPDGWGGGVALGWVTSRTEFALGVGCSVGGAMRLDMTDSATGEMVWSGDPTRGDLRRFEEGLRATLTCRREVTIPPGETLAFETYASVATDSKAAAIDVRYFGEQGYRRLLAATRRKLAALNDRLPDDLDADDVLGALTRRNRLFCYFYSLGKTLDTEELCPVTSRSSDYHVSAAYWDRDALLWSFPTILDMDPLVAREMLQVAFGRQGRNLGIHSRFIDGTMYEPGFELDELCAPFLALDRYLRETGDWSVLSRLAFDEGVERLERLLAERRHAQVALFRTDYLPTDDLARYPYCTYDNVLVWAVCEVLARIARHRKQSDIARHWSALAERVARAVREHCVTTEDGETLFVWSTDLAGRVRLYDEPPGSLILLPRFGFCDFDDPVFRATVRWIYSPRNMHYFAQADEIGCLHEPHPWVLAIANSLLLPERRESALQFLRRCPMDQGLACETVHEDTGHLVSGAHFATCAGFLCNALVEAFQAAPHGDELPVAT